MRVALIDYGSGNLASAAKALARAAGNAGHEIVTTDDPDLVRAADRIVLPGVGAFADCMRGLSAVPGMVEVLREKVLRTDAISITSLSGVSGWNTVAQVYPRLVSDSKPLEFRSLQNREERSVDSCEESDLRPRLSDELRPGLGKPGLKRRLGPGWNQRLQGQEQHSSPLLKRKHPARAGFEIAELGQEPHKVAGIAP